MAQSLASADVLRALVQAFGAPVPPSCGYSELVNALVLAGQKVPTHKTFAFQFNTPGISSGGVQFYTPTIGEVLYDAWFEVDTAWNGTTPRADFGDGGGSGLGGFFGTTWLMTGADQAFGPQMLVNSHQASYFVVSGAAADRCPPLKFTATNPLSVWVTTTGGVGGANPGATQGSAILHFTTALA